MKPIARQRMPGGLLTPVAHLILQLSLTGRDKPALFRTTKP